MRLLSRGAHPEPASSTQQGPVSELRGQKQAEESLLCPEGLPAVCWAPSAALSPAAGLSVSASGRISNSQLLPEKL